MLLLNSKYTFVEKEARPASLEKEGNGHINTDTPSRTGGACWDVPVSFLKTPLNHLQKKMN